MMSAKKIVCIGSGSLYFRNAIPQLLVRDDLAGSEIVLYDIDKKKSEMMAAMGKRLAQEAGREFRIRSTENLADAVDGADFAMSSIGSAGAEITSRVYDSFFHNADVRIPAKYGIHQVIGDTCGPAGMMMAFRSIPVYLSICREMEKRCPGVIMFNHSNPMAVICRAIHKYTEIKVVGICHGVQAGIRSAAKLLDVPAHELECMWIGTNHYYWFTRILHNGKDMYPEVMQRIAEAVPGGGERLSNDLSRIYGYRIVYCSDDHLVEFYPFLTQVPGGQGALPDDLAKAAKEHGYDENMPVPTTEPPTAEVQKAFFGEYQQLLDAVVLPAEGGNPLLAEEMGAIISSIAGGQRLICIVNLPNQGAIPNLPYEAEVELEGVTDSKGIRPLHMGEAPRILKGMLEKRFAWQDTVVDAAVKGDRGLALQALMIDEMAIWPKEAESMLDELLEASRGLLPQFWKNV